MYYFYKDSRCPHQEVVREFTPSDLPSILFCLVVVQNLHEENCLFLSVKRGIF